MGRDFPNLAVVAVILKAYVDPVRDFLEEEYQGTDDRFEAVRAQASDEGETEIVEMLDYIERKGLKETFFPE